VHTTACTKHNCGRGPGGGGESAMHTMQPCTNLHWGECTPGLRLAGVGCHQQGVKHLICSRRERIHAAKQTLEGLAGGNENLCAAISSRCGEYLPRI
jgi:hypothetical protein